IYRDNGLSERLSSLHWDEEGRPLLFNLYDYRRQLQNGVIRLREDGMVQIAVSPVKAPAPLEARL
ncbi:hypothetical protein, partial [Vibrio vulnificus]|uniref:hypothetical protein n=1 Tax=Vibrio vulnificus TaxID=672 RepID=UPI000D428140